MKIILMRHYRVDLCFKSDYHSEGFDKVSSQYNDSSVLWQAPPDLPSYKLYASSMKRAQQTAQLAFQRPFNILSGVQEVTMRSFMDTNLRLPLWLWELMGRIQWRFGSSRPYENYNETMKRLNGAIEEVDRHGESSIIVMHGLAMRYMVKVLRSRGYKGPQIIHAKNGETYEYTK